MKKEKTHFQKQVLMFSFIFMSAIVKAFVATNILGPVKMLPAGTTGVSMAINMVLSMSFGIKIGY